MFPCWPSTKIVQVIMIRRKTWPPGDGAYFPYIIYIEKFKNLLVRRPISISLGRNVSFVTLYQDYSSRHDSLKNMTDFNITQQECFFCNLLPRLFKLSWFVKKHGRQGRGIFSLYIYLENFKNLLVRNRWIEFNVTWQEWCFSDLLPRLFTPSWYVKKHGRQGAGLIFRIYLYRKL